MGALEWHIQCPICHEELEYIRTNKGDVDTSYRLVCRDGCELFSKEYLKYIDFDRDEPKDVMRYTWIVGYHKFIEEFTYIGTRRKIRIKRLINRAAYLIRSLIA